MTPEEIKADELVEKFKSQIHDGYMDEQDESAISCVILHCEGVIEVWETVKGIYSDIDADESWLEKFNHWQSILDILKNKLNP